MAKFREMDGYVLEGWMAKLVARLLATAALWVRNRHSSDIKGYKDIKKGVAGE